MLKIRILGDLKIGRPLQKSKQGFARKHVEQKAFKTKAFQKQETQNDFAKLFQKRVFRKRVWLARCKFGGKGVEQQVFAKTLF